MVSYVVLLLISSSSIVYRPTLHYNVQLRRVYSVSVTLLYKSNGVTVTSVTFCKGVNEETDNEVTFLSNGVTDLTKL